MALWQLMELFVYVKCSVLCSVAEACLTSSNVNEIFLFFVTILYFARHLEGNTNIFFDHINYRQASGTFPLDVWTKSGVCGYSIPYRPETAEMWNCKSQYWK